ncbi:hypothetical protein VP01_1703g2 [Puccinia sorghi]|uniref:Uncharacterized protein n=1 Tax=Puccinia sorghi TaxID=27349 RepID=A0A0L6VFI7_9BASI|nr:hypothetical protein VP01_1703g2 [Puccinia sorghi]
MESAVAASALTVNQKYQRQTAENKGRQADKQGTKGKDQFLRTEQAKMGKLDDRGLRIGVELKGCLEEFLLLRELIFRRLSRMRMRMKGTEFEQRINKVDMFIKISQDVTEFQQKQHYSNNDVSIEYPSVVFIRPSSLEMFLLKRAPPNWITKNDLPISMVKLKKLRPSSLSALDTVSLSKRLQLVFYIIHILYNQINSFNAFSAFSTHVQDMRCGEFGLPLTAKSLSHSFSLPSKSSSPLVISAFYLLLFSGVDFLIKPYCSPFSLPLPFIFLSLYFSGGLCLKPKRFGPGYIYLTRRTLLSHLAGHFFLLEIKLNEHSIYLHPTTTLEAQAQIHEHPVFRFRKLTSRKQNALDGHLHLIKDYYKKNVTCKNRAFEHYFQVTKSLSFLNIEKTERRLMFTQNLRSEHMLLLCISLRWIDEEMNHIIKKKERKIAQNYKICEMIFKGNSCHHISFYKKLLISFIHFLEMKTCALDKWDKNLQTIHYFFKRQELYWIILPERDILSKKDQGGWKGWLDGIFWNELGKCQRGRKLGEPFNFWDSTTNQFYTFRLYFDSIVVCCVMCWDPGKSQRGLQDHKIIPLLCSSP